MFRLILVFGFFGIFIQGATVAKRDVGYGARTCQCEVEDNLANHHEENEERLNKLDLDLNQLIARVQKVKQDFDLNAEAREKAASNAKSIMHHLEDGYDACGANEFRCASTVLECVSHLLVCDGKNDCTDGSDEDDQGVCHDPFYRGLVLEATTDFHRCDLKLRVVPENIQMRVLSVNRDPHFPNSDKIMFVFRVAMRGQHSRNEISFPYASHYNLASRTLTGSTGNADDEHHFACDVTDDGDVFMVCESYIANAPEPCAKYRYKRATHSTPMIQGTQFIEVEKDYGLKMWMKE